MSVRNPKGGSKITLLYIIAAPAVGAVWLARAHHWNMMVALVVCYGLELAFGGVFSIGRSR